MARSEFIWKIHLESFFENMVGKYWVSPSRVSERKAREWELLKRAFANRTLDGETLNPPLDSAESTWDDQAPRGSKTLKWLQSHLNLEWFLWLLSISGNPLAGKLGSSPISCTFLHNIWGQPYTMWRDLLFKTFNADIVSVTFPPKYHERHLRLDTMCCTSQYCFIFSLKLLHILIWVFQGLILMAQET